MEAYLDNSATTKVFPGVLSIMQTTYQSDFGNPSSMHVIGMKAEEYIKTAAERIAKTMKIDAKELIFTSGGTESDNWAIKGVAFASQQRRNIVTTAFEHHAVLRACASIEAQGYPVAYINPDSNGFITATALEAIVSPETMLVSVMMSNNEIGTIQPIQQLAQIAHKCGALFHTDAVQCIGHIPIDVKELDVDMLSASAHKFNGPKGIGFLYIKKGVSIEPLLNGGAQEKGSRAGTENVAAIVGMAVALKKNCRDMGAVSAHISHLEGALINSLNSAGISYVRNGSGNLIPGNMSLSFPGFEGETILHRLDLMGIQVSTGSACDSENTQISHVLRAIGVTEQIAQGTIRISLGRDNTIDEISAISSAICKIIK